MNKDIYVLREIARKVLEVRLDSSIEEIHLAYRKKAKTFHPDKIGDEMMMKIINQAYEILVKPDFNIEYNLLKENEDIFNKKDKKLNIVDYFEWSKNHFYGEGVI